MASQPKTYRVQKALAARAVHELGVGATIWEYALLWISSGRTLRNLADALGSPTLDHEGNVLLEAEVPDGVSRETVRRIVHKSGLTSLEHAPEGSEAAVEAALARAREIGASGVAEEAGSILDNVREDRDALTKAKGQADFRVWLAGIWNRKQYGKQAQLSVTHDVGALHLTAMRERAKARAASVRQAEHDGLTHSTQSPQVVDAQEVTVAALIESGTMTEDYVVQD
jgi:hypothetical protein